MYVVAIHAVSDPDAFWGVSTNEYHAINEGKAQGLPA